MDILENTGRERPRLSAREEALVRYASEGMTDAAIAQRLGISEATVSTYWGRVRIKVGPYSRTELVAKVLRWQQEEALARLREENEHTIAQLRQAALHATAQSALYRSIIENAPDAILLFSESAEVVLANQTAKDLFGYPGDRLIGLPLDRLIPGRLRDVHRTHVVEYLRHPMRRLMGDHLRTSAVGGDGREFAIRAALSTLDDPNAPMVICVVREANGGGVVRAPADDSV